MTKRSVNHARNVAASSAFPHLALLHWLLTPCPNPGQASEVFAQEPFNRSFFQPNSPRKREKLSESVWSSASVGVECALFLIDSCNRSRNVSWGVAFYDLALLASTIGRRRSRI